MTGADNLVRRVHQILVERNEDRPQTAKRIAEAIREVGSYRWVGIYYVNVKPGMVSNVAWAGPNSPAYPDFPISKGITSRVISSGKTVNVGDVAADPNYLTALDSTRSEIIVPILDRDGEHVCGTIDVESANLNAFDSKTQALLEECANLLSELWLARK
jgi:L-methionine (R)-S-oxide reductase